MHRGFYREKEIFLCQFSRPAGQVMPSVSLWLFHVGCAYRRTIILFYDEPDLSEIAFQLGYGSVSHLSRQFKQVTGPTPSYFKKMKNAGA